ncbi:HAD family hydrolase [Humisphaera borealis]|uniref:HAD family hydrolase n=1 Tax=Humisphaera borealis TaxID=2807512 RepID=A0A7M2WQ80_9BACT|nr:HAD family hydrolase [Humisphaera borealis]QOV87402.1 HAD family hydrolase [Humisphaera borealis]
MSLITPDQTPAAVLFDMDGTLTEPMLDFPRIKREMGIGDQPILEALAAMSPGDRAAAEAVLLRHEGEAARLSRLNPGCREVLALLERSGIRTALITRNSRSSVQTVLQTHQLAIQVLISREDAAPKPDPEPLYHACRRLDVSPGEVWMVGDGEFDVQAGLNAGARTVWVSHGRLKHFPETPWQEVTDLWALEALLGKHLTP